MGHINVPKILLGFLANKVPKGILYHGHCIAFELIGFFCSFHLQT